ncbi:hypothetical protein D7X33_21990 [Butyricicoccus sp. 1XD8-22]|nr:hypothetical protein D7X33_21990 [Butyricicoccus sp. 1XD8-22]
MAQLFFFPPGQLFEIHRSKFKLYPVENLGQTFYDHYFYDPAFIFPCADIFLSICSILPHLPEKVCQLADFFDGLRCVVSDTHLSCEQGLLGLDRIACYAFCTFPSAIFCIKIHNCTVKNISVLRSICLFYNVRTLIACHEIREIIIGECIFTDPS